MAGMSEFRGFSDREIKTLQRQKQQQTKQQEIKPGQVAFRPADFSRPRAKITRGEKSYDHRGTPPDGTALPTTAYFVKEAQKPPLAAKSDQTRPNETNTGEEEPEKDHRGDHHPPSSVSTATQESITESNLPDLQMDNQYVQYSLICLAFLRCKISIAHNMHPMACCMLIDIFPL
ncbi:hypothetical protein GBAR_LOCUS31126 [Geodia barretti]|uniref:Uncharacterized protein n=1 Tax=Geodia barretti TaxID=519541 RepID=A0AA35U1X5_GEOBA|nr:hypothetical protein GBAR_LOCUS31126 [Geodia barretti]